MNASTVDQSLEHVAYYSRLGNIALLVTAAIHASFVPIFFLWGAYALAIFNIVSVALYIYCYRLFPASLAKRNYTKITWLVYVEIIAHAYLACYFFGLDSGFQFHIYALAALQFLGIGNTLPTNLFRITLLTFFAVTLDVWLHGSSPLIVLEDRYLTVMRHINLAIFLLVSSCISMAYARSTAAHLNTLLNNAIFDELTGLHNSHYASIAATRKINELQRHNMPLSLMIIDVDYLRQINDSYGSSCGDAILKKIAFALKARIHQETNIARWHGGSFFILLPDTDPESMKLLADSIVEDIKQLSIEWNRANIKATVTIGGASWENDETLEELISKANRALFNGKRHGRDLYSAT